MSAAKICQASCATICVFTRACGVSTRGGADIPSKGQPQQRAHHKHAAAGIIEGASLSPQSSPFWTPTVARLSGRVHHHVGRCALAALREGAGRLFGANKVERAIRTAPDVGAVAADGGPAVPCMVGRCGPVRNIPLLPVVHTRPT